MRKVLAIVAAGLLLLAPAVLGQEEVAPENASDASFLLEIGLQPAAADLQEPDAQFLASTRRPEILASAAGCIPASKCGRICDKGQACGNSCISRSYNCHKRRDLCVRFVGSLRVRDPSTGCPTIRLTPTLGGPLNTRIAPVRSGP
jgi:hypothetical protein